MGRIVNQKDGSAPWRHIPTCEEEKKWEEGGSVTEEVK
jgi:hypothetical protein